MPSVFNDAAIPSATVEFDSVTSSVPRSNGCIPPESSTTTASSIYPVLASPGQGSATTSKPDAVSSSGSPATASDFSYAADYRGMPKGDAVINLHLNKIGNRDCILETSGSLERYFSSELEALAKFFKSKFGLPGKSWDEVKESITAHIDGNPIFAITVLRWQLRLSICIPKNQNLQALPEPAPILSLINSIQLKARRRRDARS